MSALISRSVVTVVLLGLSWTAAATDDDAIETAVTEHAATATAANEDAAAITLTEALSLTLERNPELVAFGYQIEAQQGRACRS